MTKKTATLRTVLSDEGLTIRSSAALINGVAVRRAKVLPNERGRLGEHCPGLLRIPPGALHGWTCVTQTEAYILNVFSEMYNYKEPDEFRTDPHENNIPYDWTRKDG